MQLRLGLGSRPGHRRHLAAGHAAPLDVGPARGGASARVRGRASTGTVERARRRRARRPAASRVRGRGDASPASERRGRRRRRTARPCCGCSVADPSLWWPRGHGEQPLYPSSRSTLLGDDGRARHRGSGRSASAPSPLDTTPDAHGTPFTFVVNGRPVFVKGANWIPDDCFPTRIDRARLRAAASARPPTRGINLLRVWGGGIYESERLLRALRRARPDGLAGLPVRLRRLPRGGAAARRGRRRGPRERSRRLTPHPSLVLWNGNNENIWGYERLGLEGRGSTAAPGAWATTPRCCPAIVAELDPTRPYSAGSPWSRARAGPSTPTTPTTARIHIWDVWNERDYTDYRDYVPRFARRVRLPGAADVVDADAARSHDDAAAAGLARACCSTRRPRTATPSSTRGLAPHLARAGRHATTGTGPCQLNQARAVALRRRALPVAGRRAARARSSGSSTTAGR